MGIVTSFSHVYVESLCYRAATQPQGKSARFAYICGRIQVEIQWIFKIDIDYKQRQKLSWTIAVVH
ncbi:hypothetical protein EDD22DRAFT_793346 [Suillus occidentalis]|nr:hypothetical protein EDD22DRAFT_793346 [Suillus occidentalis]